MERWQQILNKEAAMQKVAFPPPKPIKTPNPVSTPKPPPMRPNPAVRTIKVSRPSGGGISMRRVGGPKPAASTIKIPLSSSGASSSAQAAPKASYKGTPKWYSQKKVKIPAILAAVAGVGGLSGMALGPGDIDEDAVDFVADEGSPGMGEIGLGAAGGATLGGLGSLLYGKLRNKPDLQRDVIMALVGAAAGGAYPFMKGASQEKEAVDPIITPSLLATLIGFGLISAGTTGAQMYQGHKHQKQNQEMMEEQQRALESIERAKLHESERGRKSAAYGTTGALLGGATGGTLSNLYGKKTGKESLRRDIMSALAGAGLGGAAGLYAANKA